MEVLETEPRVASIADLEVAAEELEVVLSRTSDVFGSHCLTSALATLGRAG